MSGRDGPRLWGSGRWSVGDQKNRLQPAHGCSIGLFGEGKSEIPAEEAFFSQLLAYLESGFPLFVEIPSEAHAAVIVGYSWKRSAVPSQGSSSHIWTQVETLLTVDDNLLP